VFPAEYTDKNFYIAVHLFIEVPKCMWNQGCYLYIRWH